MKKFIRYFSLLELILWTVSVAAITISFIIFDRSNWLSLIASLVGVTSLIFNAKGNPAGPALGIVFCIIYGIISFTFAYYGEMITYLGMTAPMAIISLISWLKNPYNAKKAEVRINKLRGREYVFMFALSGIITLAFYFILKFFNTANLIPSTISVTTSFMAVYLSFRRSPFFALAYTANDVVLIVLWILATLEDFSYLSVVICFAAFLLNDLYAFFNWRKILKRQTAELSQKINEDC